MLLLIPYWLQSVASVLSNNSSLHSTDKHLTVAHGILWEDMTSADESHCPVITSLHYIDCCSVCRLSFHNRWISDKQRNDFFIKCLSIVFFSSSRGYPDEVIHAYNSIYWLAKCNFHRCQYVSVMHTPFIIDGRLCLTFLIIAHTGFVQWHSASGSSRVTSHLQVTGVPSLVPCVLWDWLQARCNPVLDQWFRKVLIYDIPIFLLSDVCL